MRRILAVALLVGGLVVGTGSAVAAASGPSELELDGLFYPESITAGPDGALYVSSLANGNIVRFAPGSSESQPFVPAGNGTAGVMADPDRDVLWACAVDLSFRTPSELRAFDLQTGALGASYRIPEGGLCADIALARGAVYVTDTLKGRILRLRGGTLEVWSDAPQLAGGAGFLQINGIAFDGRQTLYTTNYSTGKLFAVRVEPGGSAGTPAEIRLDTTMTNPDGIRWHDGYLYVAENLGGLTRVDPRAGTRTVLDASLDQPSSLVFVCDDIWITEGQAIRFQTGEAPNLPFKVVRRSAERLHL
jgi:sugar lactone lactonase YvrE